MPLASPRMTADDYWALPEGVRAELIDGELWDLAASSQLHQVSHDRTPLGHRLLPACHTPKHR